MIKDKKKYNEYMNAYMKRKYSRRRAKAIVLLGGKCVKCGTQDKLHFDHIDPKTKINSIAQLSSCSEEKFKTELAKCQLLCDNCHKQKTLSDGSNCNKVKYTKCSCGKVFNTVKQYAGHKAWCKIKGR